MQQSESSLHDKWCTLYNLYVQLYALVLQLPRADRLGWLVFESDGLCECAAERKGTQFLSLDERISIHQQWYDQLVVRFPAVRARGSGQLLLF